MSGIGIEDKWSIFQKKEFGNQVHTVDSELSKPTSISLNSSESSTNSDPPSAHSVSSRSTHHTSSQGTAASSPISSTPTLDTYRWDTIRPDGTIETHKVYNDSRARTGGKSESKFSSDSDEDVPDKTEKPLNRKQRSGATAPEDKKNKQRDGVETVIKVTNENDGWTDKLTKYGQGRLRTASGGLRRLKRSFTD